MSSVGNDPDEYTPGNQADGSYYNLFPESPRPGLIGGQYADMQAGSPAHSGMGNGPGVDMGGDGTGLPPSVTIAPDLPQQAGPNPDTSPGRPLMLDAQLESQQPASSVQNFTQTALSGSGARTVDIDKFVGAMDRNALPQSKGICATNSRLGLEAGGLDTTGHPVDAKDYGPFLVTHGAAAVPSDNYAPQAGDIAVFDGTDQHKYGHIQVFDGNQWVSDFKQRGYSPYRDKSSTPPSTVYRFPGN
jgi:hypothetical protein